MKVNVNIDNDLYNDVYLPYLENENDILILFGGSASGKSVFQAMRIITNILKGDRNYLCLRKVGNTIRDSIFPELRNVIDAWNLDRLFDINKTEKEITCKNGYKIICRGLDNPEKIKSIRTQKGIVTDVWLEEATEMNEADFSQIEHRLRGESKYKKQIVMTFNPISQLHWIKKRFFDLAKEDVKILKTTYLDNKYLKQEDIDRIEKYKDIDKYYYDVYALGNWGVLGNLVFTNWVVDDLSGIKDSFNTYYYGLDFGYTNDPTAIVKVALKDDKIFILDEIHQKGLQNNEIAKLLKEFAQGHYVYCDCAEPKSIKELRDHGINALAVTKGKDSVKHGIQWLKQKKIIVGKNCPYILNELQTYKYREDKDGNVLNEPVDMNNHCFVGNTKILMSNNKYKKIKNIKVGDEVLTRSGIRKVIKFWDNGKQYINKYSVNNKILNSTNRHNVIIHNGKKYIKDLTPLDICYIYKQEVYIWLVIKTMLKLLSLRELNLNVIRILKILQVKDISIAIITFIQKAFIHCIGKYGKTKMERYQKAMTFIIKMAIILITILQILKLLKAGSIIPYMAKNGLLKIKNGLKSFGIKVLYRLKNGINQVKVLNGIKNMLKDLILVFLNTKTKSVKYAKSNLQAKRRNKNFALINVNHNLEEIIKQIISQNNVNGVVRILKQTDIIKLCVAQEHVQIKTCGLKEKTKRVYNLTIEENHEYFANDILVSNCLDSLRYSLESMMRMNIVRSSFSASSLGL